MRCSARFDLSQAGANKRWLAFLPIGSRLKGWNIMPTNINELLPTARDILRQSALKEAEKAEKVKLAASVIQRAVRSGLTEVQVYRFPNVLCTDHGRAINQREQGWENTLTGIPKEIFQLWSDYLKPRGYRIAYQVIDFPGGMPGDIGITLSWGESRG